MAAAMSPAPLLTWYSFDFVGSALDSETGMAWVPDNPSYDPGPPTRVRVVREDDDDRRKRKGRKGGADGPTASNVSTNSETGNATSRGPRMSGHGHQPLFKPPPHIGPSRYVTSIRSPGQQPDDVPLFVSRDSPDYEKYRSLGETSVRCLFLCRRSMAPGLTYPHSRIHNRQALESSSVGHDKHRLDMSRQGQMIGPRRTAGAKGVKLRWDSD